MSDKIHKQNIGNVREDVEEERYFYREEDVRRINWRIPKETYKKLRKESVARAGTTQHMGMIATEAMVAHMMDDSNNIRHKTWVRLKRAYDYSDAGINVRDWRYKHFVDYAKIDVEKSPLSVSVPTSIVADFTRDVKENEYGNKLANAIDNELRKRHQIRKMHKLIDRMHGRVNEIESIEIDVDGTPIDTAELRMTHVDAEVVLERKDVNNYKNRRGAIMAEIRASHNDLTKQEIYALSEKFGASSRPTKRKDYEAILNHIQTSEEETDWEIHPAYHLRRELETYNLPQFVEYKPSNILIKQDEKSRNKTQRVLSLSIYNTTKKSREEVWQELIDEFVPYINNIVEPVWQAIEDPALTNGWEVARTKADVLPKLEESFQACAILLNKEDIETVPSAERILEFITDNLDEKPNDFERKWDKRQRENKYNHTNKNKLDEESQKHQKTFVW